MKGKDVPYKPFIKKKEVKEGGKDGKEGGRRRGRRKVGVGHKVRSKPAGECSTRHHQVFLVTAMLALHLHKPNTGFSLSC